MPDDNQRRRATDAKQQMFGIDARVLILLAAQIIAATFAYGQLKATVDMTHEQIQRIETRLNDLTRAR